MSKKNIDLIRQALAAAESSIKLAKQLLNDVESGKVSTQDGISNNAQKAKDLPGISGVFDGEFMVSESGEKFPVPENYSSKSMLVVGDTLKLVEEGKEKRFKQIEHVKRHKTIGILTKKDGKWRAITPEGSYKVLQASIDHYGGEVGDEVVLHLPSNNLTVGFGAIESIKNSKSKDEENQEEKNEAPISSGKSVEEKVEAKASVEQTKKPEAVKSVKKEVAAPSPKVEKPKSAEKPASVVPISKESKKETPTQVPSSPVKVEKNPIPTAVEVSAQPKVESNVPAAVPMEVSPEEEELT